MKFLTTSVTRNTPKNFGLVRAGIAVACALVLAVDARAEGVRAKKPATISWSQLGATAGVDYKGDGLAVVPPIQGARLCCVFQQLEGEVTREGLCLSSTATSPAKDCFRIVAVDVKRLTSNLTRGYRKLENTGTVAIEGQTVRFIRPDLIEEYTVSMDGVRQDFVVVERPAGAGELAVGLAVNGATIEPRGDGAQLVLENSGRKIAYNRLRVTDATGKDLPARIEILIPNSQWRIQNSELSTDLAVVLDDTDAVYPVRIDPTFSDANWISMGGIPGVSDPFNYDSDRIHAVVADGLGNLYIGGEFAIAGDVVANHIAKWDGNKWSALGTGMDGDVFALAVLGTNVYAGGAFTTAGGIAATNIAKWDGSSWSALGSGMDSAVEALAVSGDDLYAAGWFTTAGGVSAIRIAKWDGRGWFALGSGVMNYPAKALAVLGSDLYVGGDFTIAGGKVSAYIAKAIVYPPILAIHPDGFGGYFINFTGVPGSGYRLQRAPTLTGPWTSSGSQTAPASGQVEFWDLFPPADQGFYRTVQP